MKPEFLKTGSGGGFTEQGSKRWSNSLLTDRLQSWLFYSADLGPQKIADMPGPG
jgi:hypothetical protein